MLAVTLDALAAIALLWLLCTRCARLPLLCRLGFWVGACGLLLHTLYLVPLAVTQAGYQTLDTGPGRLLPAAGYWLLALGWLFAPAPAEETHSSADCADGADSLDLTDYTKSRQA